MREQLAGPVPVAAFAGGLVAGPGAGTALARDEDGRGVGVEREHGPEGRIERGEGPEHD